MDSWASHLARAPADEIAVWREHLQRPLSTLGLSTDRVIVDLVFATRNFLRNRAGDEQSRTAGYLKRELADLGALSGEALPRRLAALGNFELAPFFGVMPGASIELSIDNEAHLRLLPDDEDLVLASIKTLVRHGDHDVAPTGLVYRRRSIGIAGQVPQDASMEDLARFLTGLVGIGALPVIPIQRRQHLLAFVAGHLLVAGSLGTTTLFRPIADQLSNATFDEQMVLLDEIALLCLQDFEDATGNSRALATLILTKITEQASADERKEILILFSKIFPQALAGFASALAERVDTQYRLEGSARSGRRDARRWHEAHAGWRLIDEVLDVVWPVERGEPRPGEREAIASVVRETIVFANVHNRRETKACGAARSSKGHDTKRLVGEQRERDEVANAGNLMVNDDHVKKLIALRSGIQKLDAVLFDLDRRALIDLEPRSDTDENARQELSELRSDIEALQSWRRELVQRRERGDYERVKSTEPRATGARVALPRMPQVKAETLADDEEAIAKIVAAVRTLQRASK